MRRLPQSLRNSIAAFVLAAAPGGCAGYDDPYYVHSVWRPADAANTGAAVFFLTDRHLDPNFPGGFDYARSGAASCGVIRADVPAARLPAGTAVFAKETGRDSLSCGNGQTGLASAIARAARQKNCGSVLVFVHGFDTGFETAVLRAAQLDSDTQWRCAVAAFDWSSSGKRSEYDKDLQRSADAEPLFGDFLRALSEAGLKIDIVAHSMGTKLVLDALEKTDTRAGQVIFAAPDIGLADESSTMLNAAAVHFNRLTIYASHEDAVLAVSEKINHGIARLGHEPRAALRNAAPNIDVIDASDVPGDFLGHNYYGLSYEIIADMALTLAGVPAPARLEPRADAQATLLPGEYGLPYRLHVAPSRAPDFLTRALRWLVTAFAD